MIANMCLYNEEHPCILSPCENFFKPGVESCAIVHSAPSGIFALVDTSTGDGLYYVPTILSVLGNLE